VIKEGVRCLKEGCVAGTHVGVTKFVMTLINENPV